MKTVINYMVVCTKDIVYLSEKVRSSLESGWQPYGNLIYLEHASTFSQPMVKYLEDSNEHKIQQINRMGATGRHLS